MKKFQLPILIISAAFFAGCATVAPSELVDARSSYKLASEGPAQQYVPAELHKANEALTLAERSFEKDSDSYKTKDLAYVAQRKSEQAAALGSIAAAKANKERANADYLQKQADIIKQKKQDLSDSERRTADAQAENFRQAEAKAAKEKADAAYQRQQSLIAQGKADLNESERRAAMNQAELEKQAALAAAAAKADAELLKEQTDNMQALKDSEKRTADAQAAAKAKADAELQKQQADNMQSLKDSEKRTADALAELASLASLKEEERGLVLTLSGSVLFKSGDSNLMQPAQVKLDQVAKSLLAIRARNLIVEGHSDSQGSDAYNQKLSQRRADAVRDYLVQRGYPSDHIQARGLGEGKPVAKNSSAEGRANNRRVEIVIERESQAPKK